MRPAFFFSARVSISGNGSLNKPVARSNWQQDAAKTLSGDMLLSVYPNPAYTAAMFTYSLQTAGTVNLGVYDALGNETLTLANSEQTAGVHTVTADLHTLNSGVYFCKLLSGGEVLVKQISIIK